MMVQTAAAVSAVPPSTEDWLHAAALTQINLRKWHESREVSLFLDFPAQTRLSGTVEKWKERHVYCLLPNLWIRPPVPPIGPQIICWSSHTLILHIHDEKQHFIVRKWVDTLWKTLISWSLQHIHASTGCCYIRQPEETHCSYFLIPIFHLQLSFSTIFPCLLPLSFCFFPPDAMIYRCRRDVRCSDGEEMMASSEGRSPYSSPASFLTHYTTRAAAAHWSYPH